MDRVPAFGLRLLSLAALASVPVAAHAIATPHSVRSHLDISTLSQAEGFLQSTGAQSGPGGFDEDGSVGGLYEAPEFGLISLPGDPGPALFPQPESGQQLFGTMQDDDIFHRFAGVRAGIPMDLRRDGADKGGIVMLAVAPPDALDMTSLRFGSGEAPFESDGISISGVPEPAGWALLLLGFGLVGAGVRARRRAVVLA